MLDAPTTHRAHPGDRYHVTGALHGSVEHRFYAWSAIAALAIVFAGFARSSIRRLPAAHR
jgi:hypothetical protein